MLYGGVDLGYTDEGSIRLSLEQNSRCEGTWDTAILALVLFKCPPYYDGLPYVLLGEYARSIQGDVVVNFRRLRTAPSS